MPGKLLQNVNFFLKIKKIIQVFSKNAVITKRSKLRAFNMGKNLGIGNSDFYSGQTIFSNLSQTNQNNDILRRCLSGEFKFDHNGNIVTRDPKELNEILKKLREIFNKHKGNEIDSPKTKDKTQETAPSKPSQKKDLNQTVKDIVSELIKYPAPHTYATTYMITSKNIAYVVAEYKNQTGRSLIKDMAKQWSKYMDIKDAILSPLYQRAKELNIPNITDDFYNFKTVEQMDNWVSSVTQKILEAENKKETKKTTKSNTNNSNKTQGKRQKQKVISKGANGWYITQDSEGKLHYYNKEGKAVSEDEFAKTCPSMYKNAQKLKPKVISKGKNGWYITQDSEGKLHYYNKEGKAVSEDEFAKTCPSMYKSAKKLERKNPAAQSGTGQNALNNKSFDEIKKDAGYIAQKLKKEISGLSVDKSQIINILKNIKRENVAFVVSEYLRIAKESLADAIDGEMGLNINHVKQYICYPLAHQAQVMGIPGIYFGDYQKINDMDKLNEWINKSSEKIRNKTLQIAGNAEASGTTIRRLEGYPGYYVKEITKNSLFAEAGIQSQKQIFDPQGHMISNTTTFQNGKIVEEKYEYKDGKQILKSRKLLQKPAQTEKKESEKVYDAHDITISLPDNASQNAKDFAAALQKNKAYLMKILNLDNESYDKFARLAMAIAEQETNFGQNEGALRQAKYYTAVADTITSGVVTGYGDGGLINQLHSLSCGMTQIKYSDAIKDSWVKDKFDKIGVDNPLELFNTEKSAMATIIYLYKKQMETSNEACQQGREAADGVIATVDGWEMVNGHLENTYSTKSFVSHVTDEDVLCYAWNRGPASVKSGTMVPEANAYTRNIHKYLEKYKIQQTGHVTKFDNVKTPEGKPIQNSKITHIKPIENCGPIGSIIFMPKMYSNSPVNSEKETDKLRNALKNNNNLSEDLKERLIKAVQNKEISFEFGVNESEIRTLTSNTVEKLLDNLEKLKSAIEADGQINFSDGISSDEAVKLGSKYKNIIRQAEFRFRREYLNSISPRHKMNEVDSKNVLMKPNNNSMVFSDNKERRGFAGRVRDDGVNPNNTTDASALLARSAQNVAKRMNSAGMCMTGFRAAIREAGIDDSDLVESKPRTSIRFFERHPEMFDEVMWINTGNNTVRQINSTDLPNLPAGYIAIWVPDPNNEKYSSLEGHICITNGNGQAYADETDNLDWSTYSGDSTAGKGEHGHFRVFKLSNKWTVENGKLKFNK